MGCGGLQMVGGPEHIVGRFVETGFKALSLLRLVSQHNGREEKTVRENYTEGFTREALP